MSGSSCPPPMPADPAPSVTCVIPTHGRPGLLRHALESVAGQTRAPDEVIVVDDTCSRETEHASRELAERSGLPIRYLAHPGGRGASSSRNAGARAARGDVLAFLDDDDRWAPRYLEAAVDTMVRTARPMVFTWLRVDSDDRPARLVRLPSGLTAADVLARNPGVTGSNIFLRREAFTAVGGFDEALWVSNDKDFLVRALDAELPYAVVPEGLVHKVVHPGERLTALTPRRVEGLRRYYAKHESRFSAEDRRWLQFHLRRVILAVAPDPVQRLRSLVGLVPLLGPTELRGVREAAGRRLRRRGGPA